MIRRTNGHEIAKKVFDFAFKRLRNRRMNDVKNEPGQTLSGADQFKKKMLKVSPWQTLNTKVWSCLSEATVSWTESDCSRRNTRCRRWLLTKVKTAQKRRDFDEFQQSP